jgi:hypothetical protein
MKKVKPHVIVNHNITIRVLHTLCNTHNGSLMFCLLSHVVNHQMSFPFAMCAIVSYLLSLVVRFSFVLRCFMSSAGLLILVDPEKKFPFCSLVGSLSAIKIYLGFERYMGVTLISLTEVYHSVTSNPPK